MAEMEREPHPHFRPYGLALAYHALGSPEASDDALAELIEVADESAYQVAGVYAFRGETDRAFEWLERAYTQRDPGLVWLKVYPLFRNLYDDPRWKPLSEKMGLPD